MLNASRSALLPARLSMIECSARGTQGTWWPRTGSLSTELIALNKAMEGQHGLVHRVTYSPGAWDEPESESCIAIGAGCYVRLVASSSLPSHLIMIATLQTASVRLLVLPPGPESEHLWRSL